MRFCFICFFCFLLALPIKLKPQPRLRDKDRATVYEKAPMKFLRSIAYIEFRLQSYFIYFEFCCVRCFVCVCVFPTHERQPIINLSSLVHEPVLVFVEFWNRLKHRIKYDKRRSLKQSASKYDLSLAARFNNSADFHCSPPLRIWVSVLFIKISFIGHRS